MTVLRGDCVEVMAGMEPVSVDAIVTDPPYGLEFMGKEWDRLWNRERSDFAVRPNGGFSPFTKARPIYEAGPKAQTWHAQWAAAALRVAKPGAYLLAFGGSRTVHRMTCALEDAGWIVRDMLVWAYASGFPKSYNTGSDERFCSCKSPTEYNVRPVWNGHVSEAGRDEGGRREVLQPPVQWAGVPAEVEGPKAPAPWIGEPGLEGRGDDQAAEGQLPWSALRSGAGMGAADGTSGRLHHGASAGDGRVDGAPDGAVGSSEPREPRPERQPAREPDPVAVERRSQARRGRADCSRCGKPLPPRGLGSALKPAWEPIVLCRKPMIGSLAENWIAHGTGSLNIDSARIPSRDDNARRPSTVGDTAAPFGRGMEMGGLGSDLGRFPANVILTDPIFDGGWHGVVGGGETSSGSRSGEYASGGFLNGSGPVARTLTGDTGTYSRFFLIPKAPTSERRLSDGRRSPHPTQKPEALIRHLVTLVTPTGGLVLDPFLGSGTLGVVCDGLGIRWLGIEREPEYADWAEDRIRDGRPLWDPAA